MRLDAREHLDFQASKKALQDLARACHKRGLDRALLDLRTVPIPAKQLFTPNELAALVMTFREAGFSKEQRLAILYHQDVYRGVRTFAFISRLRGLQVQAFSDFEAALNWLSEQPDSSAGNPPCGVPIPIASRPKVVGKFGGGLSSGRRAA
jgi:hypothetical protein